MTDEPEQSVAELWQRIDIWLQTNAPDVYHSLRPGASEEQIKEAEAVMGITFPDDVRASYAIHDGQKSGAEADPKSVGLFGEEEFFSLQSMVEQWHSMKDLLDKGTFTKSVSASSVGVENVWWSTQWIPITRDDAANYTCVDMGPTSQGTVGQVIFMYHDSSDRGVSAPNFTAWLACQAMTAMGLVAKMLSESRFSRRRHRFTTEDWQAILTRLAQDHPADTFVVDSGPLAVCHKQRAARSKLYRDEAGAYWGFCAAKEEYFCGLKAHTVVVASGRAVEEVLLCGCRHDLTGLKEMTLPLPEGATRYGDKAYTDYVYEDALHADSKITRLPIRKGTHKRPHTREVARRLSHTRKRIETTFSQITAKLPRRIHAVIPAGFESKVMAAFVAFAIVCAENENLADKGRAAS